MDLILRFGGALLGLVLLLYAVLLLITRIYIHSFKKRMTATKEELDALRAEVKDLKDTLDQQPLIYRPSRQMETVQVQ